MQIAARTPAPGGGAVAAVSGARGAALAQMVVAYSLGKKTPEADRPALERAAGELERVRGLFLALAAEDAEAFARLSELRKKPDGDPERSAGEAEAVDAVVGAPRASLAAACDLLRHIEDLGPITNTRLASDLAVAACQAEAAAKSAAWNIRVNLSLLDGDPARRDAAAGEAERGVRDAAERRERVEAACADKT